MAITFRGVNNAVGQASGSAAASTVSITPTLPGSAASGDRIYVYQAGTTTSGTTPAGWTVVGTKDTTLGSGAAASGSGLRRATWYWRDYDGVWTMPAFTLTSTANNSHWIGAVAITPTAGSIFNTPTITTVGAAFNAATTSYTDSSAASFTTHSNGFLLIGTGLNDNVTSTVPALTQSGATFGTVTERCDGGTGTGFITAGQVHTCSVTTGAAATTTFTQTLSAASQGETLIVEQTESVIPAWPYFAASSTLSGANSGTAAIPVPAGVAANDIILALIYTDPSTTTATPPDGTWTAAPGSPVTQGANQELNVYWKRATGADTGTYTFTLSGGSPWRKCIAANYKNCIASGNPINTDTTGVSGTGTAPSLSLTTTVTNTLMVWIGFIFGGGTCATPAGFTVDQSMDVSVDNTAYLCSKSLAAAGGSGTISATWTSSDPRNVEWLGALKPPGGAAAVVIPGRATQQVPIIRSSLY